MLSLSVKELAINKKQSCTLSMYTDKLNFELTMREFLPNEKTEKQVFQLPGLSKNNFSTQVAFQMAEAKEKSIKYWTDAIEKIATKNSFLQNAIVFYNFPLGTAVFAIVLSLLSMILVLVLWCRVTTIRGNNKSKSSKSHELQASPSPHKFIRTHIPKII